MVLVLPTDLDAFEASLDSARLDDVVSSLGRHEVAMTMPKFKFESSFDLVKALSDLGMPIAFSGRADFSGVTREADLYLSGVFHKAFVAVNEAGTEAAASTAVVGGVTSVPEPAEIHLNRPFLFFVRDRSTNTVLFFGRVTDPS
jgi:serpin B